jgi:hypothetical protein
VFRTPIWFDGRQNASAAGSTRKAMAERYAVTG